MNPEREVYRVHVKKTIEVTVDVEAKGIDGADDFVNANVLVDLSPSVSCTPGCGKLIRDYKVVEDSETTSIGSIEDVTGEYDGK